MSLENVIQKILDRSKAEADAIVGTAKTEMEKTLQATREKGQAEKGRRLDEAADAAEKLRVQERARAELESRKIMLGAQREVLEAVKAKALERLDEPRVKERILGVLLDEHKGDWKAGKVYCKHTDREIVRGIVGARFGGTIECAGGIVIESADGTRRTDLRFETLLDDIWEDSVKEIAEMLWPRH